MVVWVDAWEMQCCGTPFEIGELVEWTVEDASGRRDWLTDLLGDELAAQVGYIERHHAEDPQRPRMRLVGRVARVRSAFRRYVDGPPGSQTLVAVPGSLTWQDPGRADGWEDEVDGRLFCGYVVEVDLTQPVTEGPASRSG